MLCASARSLGPDPRRTEEGGFPCVRLRTEDCELPVRGAKLLKLTGPNTWI